MARDHNTLVGCYDNRMCSKLEQPVGFLRQVQAALTVYAQISVIVLVKTCILTLYVDGRWDVTLLSKHGTYLSVVY